MKMEKFPDHPSLTSLLGGEFPGHKGEEGGEEEGGCLVPFLLSLSPPPSTPTLHLLRLSTLFAFLSVNKCLSDPLQGV